MRSKKLRRAVSRLLGARRFGDAFGQLAGMGLVAGLDIGEVAEKLADAGIGRARRRAAVEIGGLFLHRLGALAHGVDIERLGHP